MCRAGELEEPMALAERTQNKNAGSGYKGDLFFSDRIRWLGEAGTSWRDHMQCFFLRTLVLRASGGGVCGEVGSLKKMLLEK